MYLNPKFKPQAIFSGCPVWFVSNLIRHPEDKISHDAAHIINLCTLSVLLVKRDSDGGGGEQQQPHGQDSLPIELKSGKTDGKDNLPIGLRVLRDAQEVTVKQHIHSVEGTCMHI